MSSKLVETSMNHGDQKAVVLKLVVEQDVSITIDDLVEMIAGDGCASDTMAKIINAMGKVNQKYQSTTCSAVDNLDAWGFAFISDMGYFIGEKRKIEQVQG